MGYGKNNGGDGCFQKRGFKGIPLKVSILLMLCTQGNPLVATHQKDIAVKGAESSLKKVVNLLLGDYTLSEHYVTGRQPTELLFYQGDKILPQKWWERHKFLVSVMTGVCVVFGNEFLQYYTEHKHNLGYSSPWDVIRRDQNTDTDIVLGLVNLALFTFDKMFPALEGIIRIETHNPILKGYLNPLKGVANREEVIFSSKYLSVGAFQIGIALGHGDSLTAHEKESRGAPTWFYRFFAPRKMGIEYIPGGPPVCGAYCGLSTRYDFEVNMVPFALTAVVFTSEQKKIAFRTALTFPFNY